LPSQQNRALIYSTHFIAFQEQTMFISNAYAQTAAAPGGDSLIGLLPIFLMFVLLYFLMIRPQMKKAKEQKAMIDGLQKGDEVIAVGIIGKIAKVGDTFISLEVADGKVLHMQKNAVNTLLPKGTFADLVKKD
jgi:preprotein translocase subunit YajC